MCVRDRSKKPSVLKAKRFICHHYAGQSRWTKAKQPQSIDVICSYLWTDQYIFHWEEIWKHISWRSDLYYWFHMWTLFLLTFPVLNWGSKVLFIISEKWLHEAFCASAYNRVWHKFSTSQPNKNNHRERLLTHQRCPAHRCWMNLSYRRGSTRHRGQPSSHS